MTVRTRAQLNSDADTELANNTTALITPTDVRQRVKDLADSALLAEDIGVSVQAYADITSGTWTPVVSFTTPGDVGVAYTIQDGTYLKIGDWVVVSFDLAFTATYTTAAGTFVISGLPAVAATSPAGNAAFVAPATAPAYPASCTSIALTLNVANQQLRLTGQGSGTVTAFSVTEFTSGVARSLRGTMIYAT